MKTSLDGFLGETLLNCGFVNVGRGKSVQYSKAVSLPHGDGGLVLRSSNVLFSSDPRILI